jgi:hypothetical protein
MVEDHFTCKVADTCCFAIALEHPSPKITGRRRRTPVAVSVGHQSGDEDEGAPSYMVGES